MPGDKPPRQDSGLEQASKGRLDAWGASRLSARQGSKAQMGPDDVQPIPPQMGADGCWLATAAQPCGSPH